jgi:hypothetical protein
MSDTYAIRTYESARETSAAKPLTITALADYADYRLNRDERNLSALTGIFLETDTTNVRAIDTYTNLAGAGNGFDTVGKTPNGERLAMMLPLHRIVQITNVDDFPL